MAVESQQNNLSEEVLTGMNSELAGDPNALKDPGWLCTAISRCQEAQKSMRWILLRLVVLSLGDELNDL